MSGKDTLNLDHTIRRRSPSNTIAAGFDVSIGIYYDRGMTSSTSNDRHITLSYVLWLIASAFFIASREPAVVYHDRLRHVVCPCLAVVVADVRSVVGQMAPRSRSELKKKMWPAAAGWGFHHSPCKMSPLKHCDVICVKYECAIGASENE
jgi:hypothetical protein